MWIIAGVLALLLTAVLWWAYGYYERSMTQSSVKRAPVATVQEPGGESISGRPLAADDPRRVAGGPLGAPLRGCVWGGPGQHAYSGTLTAALTAAQLPAEIVAKLTIMRDGGAVSDRLILSSAGIHSIDYQRDFGYTMKAMTFDGSMCFDSRINMTGNSTGSADLYELVDARRLRYSVMVVAAGGNVAVLEAPPGR